jgi:HEAT repeat protein
MTRLPSVAVLTLALVGAPALAGPQERAQEANEVLRRFSVGEISTQQAANRIEFLGAQVAATIHLVGMLRRNIDPNLEGAAVDLLATVTVPAPDAEVLLISALGREDVGMRRNAARGLGRTGSPHAVKALIGVLQDKASGVRRQAALSLAKIGAAKAGKPLVNAAKAEDDPEVRSIMLVAVGKVGDVKQAGALKSFLTSSSESTRLAAGRALCMLGTRDGMAFAQGRLQSKEPTERLQGVLLFEGAAAKRVTKALKPMLGDSDHRVRATAARILAEGGDKKMVEWLVVESAKNTGEARMPYEDALERLHLMDEDRSKILKRVGLK